MKLELQRIQPRASVSYVSLKASVTYVKATVFLYLDERGLNKFIRDSFTMTDELTYAVSKSLADIAGMADVLSYAFIKGAESDDIEVQEAISLAIGYIRSFDEIVTIDDTAVFTTGKGLNDVPLMADEITGKDVTKLFIDDTFLEDTADVNNGDGLEYSFGKGVTDAVESPTDNLTHETGKGLDDSVDSAEEITSVVIDKLLQDAATITEQIAQVIDKGTFTDDVSTEDVLDRSVDYDRSFSDAVTPTDDLQSVDAGKDLADSVDPEDQITDFEQETLFDESATSSDEATKSFDKLQSDAATASDEESHIVAFERQFADVLSGIDSHTFDASKTLSDSYVVTDPGRLVSTDYWADYCSEDYVGTGRTF